ncbi:MAG: hypothetical protein JO301_16955 [Chitinophagaceae bacterium]|nr:hypothetical protein [Chitinophagaceae bacterium]
MEPFFKNPETEAKYESVFMKDKDITIPGQYSGKLSAISPEIAQKLIDMEDNQVKAKAATSGAVKPAGKDIKADAPPADGK